MSHTTHKALKGLSRSLGNGRNYSGLLADFGLHKLPRKRGNTIRKKDQALASIVRGSKLA